MTENNHDIKQIALSDLETIVEIKKTHLAPLNFGLRDEQKGLPHLKGRLLNIYQG